jgi:hypothetical protein
MAVRFNAMASTAVGDFLLIDYDRNADGSCSDASTQTAGLSSALRGRASSDPAVSTTAFAAAPGLANGLLTPYATRTRG